MTILPLTFLDQATPQQLRDLSAESLQNLAAALTAFTELAKRRRQVLEDGLQLKYLDSAISALKGTGRNTGVIRFKDGPCTILAEIPKKVIWEQDKLVQALDKLPLHERARSVKTIYAIDERKYTAWPDHLKDLFAEARTLKIGKPTFQLKGEQ